MNTYLQKNEIINAYELRKSLGLLLIIIVGKIPGYIDDNVLSNY